MQLFSVINPGAYTTIQDHGRFAVSVSQHDTRGRVLDGVFEHFARYAHPVLFDAGPAAGKYFQRPGMGDLDSGAFEQGCRGQVKFPDLWLVEHFEPGFEYRAVIHLRAIRL